MRFISTICGPLEGGHFLCKDCSIVQRIIAGGISDIAWLFWCTYYSKTTFTSKATFTSDLLYWESGRFSFGTLEISNVATRHCELIKNVVVSILTLICSKYLKIEKHLTVEEAKVLINTIHMSPTALTTHQEGLYLPEPLWFFQF